MSAQDELTVGAALPDGVVWQQLASCLGSDPDLFFPARGESSREARLVCVGCVVRFECLEHSMQVPERFGIWGGLAERQRRRLRRLRKNAARAAEMAGVDPSVIFPDVDLDDDDLDDDAREYADVVDGGESLAIVVELRPRGGR